LLIENVPEFEQSVSLLKQNVNVLKGNVFLFMRGDSLQNESDSLFVGNIFWLKGGVSLFVGKVDNFARVTSSTSLRLCANPALFNKLCQLG
jgi:hypothetical protein